MNVSPALLLGLLPACLILRLSWGVGKDIAIPPWPFSLFLFVIATAYFLYTLDTISRISYA